jgi:hypothetical protein
MAMPSPPLLVDKHVAYVASLDQVRDLSTPLFVHGVWSGLVWEYA